MKRVRWLWGSCTRLCPPAACSACLPGPGKPWPGPWRTPHALQTLETSETQLLPAEEPCAAAEQTELHSGWRVHSSWASATPPEGKREEIRQWLAVFSDLFCRNNMFYWHVPLNHVWYVFTDLLWDREFWEVWDVSGPLNGAEEESGCQLTDAVNAHDGGAAGRCLHLCLVVGGPVTAVGVRLSPEELGDELWNRLPVEVICPDVSGPWASHPTWQGVWTDTWVSRRNPTSLDRCRTRKEEKPMRISSGYRAVYVFNVL